MTIDPRTLTTISTGRHGRTRLTILPTERPDVLVYVTSRHNGKPSFAGDHAYSYRTTMNVVHIANDNGLRVEEFAPAEAVPVATTSGATRYAARNLDAHHARALEIVAAMSDPTRRAPEGVTRATLNAGTRALGSWLRGRVTA